MTSSNLDKRFDQAVSEQFGLSRTSAQKAIKNGYFEVNTKPEKASYLLKASDTITQTKALPEQAITLSPTQGDIDMLFEDDHLMVINKPAGLIVHPVDYNQQNTLVNHLCAYGCPLSDLGGELRPGIVHRLDKDTEGLMIVAKHNQAHERLKAQFANRSTSKRYYAMVHGSPRQDDFSIEFPLGRHPSKRRLQTVLQPDDPQAKAAKTDVRVIKRFGTKALLDIVLHTGRTHQIRVHLSHMGFPLIGDGQYGKAGKAGGGQLLQAYELGFVHPHTQQQFQFSLPLSRRLSV